jgi:hypothetical protein
VSPDGIFIFVLVVGSLSFVVYAAMRSRQQQSMRIKSEVSSGAGGEQAQSADSGQAQGS